MLLRFAEPFWRDAGQPHLMIFPRDPADSMVWVIGQDAFGGGPVLCFHVFHRAAARLAGRTADEAAQWALGLLAEATGPTRTGRWPAASARRNGFSACPASA